jgi:hypothetical protein
MRERMHFKYHSIVLLVMSLASNCFAAPDKVLYELQEKCAKRMESVFKPEEKDVKGVITYSYFNHFSVTLNRCFVKEVMRIYPANPSMTSVIHTIFDVNEGTEQAIFDKNPISGKVNACRVGEKLCSTEEAFEIGIKRFMEN